MKHAWMIMFHNNFSQLQELIRYLDDDDSLFVLGIDGRVANSELKKEILSCIHKSTYKWLELKIFWGGASQIQSCLKMIRTACEYKVDYLHFLTGVDVPLMTKRNMTAFFEKHQGVEFVEYAPENYSFAYFKCNYYHLFIENQHYRTNTLLKFFNHSCVRMQKLLGINRKRAQLYHGSAYFSVTSQFANYLLASEETIVKNYRYTLGADEVWIQTELKRSPFCEKIYDFESSDGNLRFIDWKHREENSPHTFTIEDEKELLAIMDTKYLFARKFDENRDREIIARIYSALEKQQFERISLEVNL